MTFNQKAHDKLYELNRILEEEDVYGLDTICSGRMGQPMNSTPALASGWFTADHAEVTEVLSCITANANATLAAIQFKRLLGVVSLTQQQLGVAAISAWQGCGTLINEILPLCTLSILPGDEQELLHWLSASSWEQWDPLLKGRLCVNPEDALQGMIHFTSMSTVINPGSPTQQGVFVHQCRLSVADATQSEGRKAGPTIVLGAAGDPRITVGVSTITPGIRFYLTISVNLKHPWGDQPLQTESFLATARLTAQMPLLEGSASAVGKQCLLLVSHALVKAWQLSLDLHRFQVQVDGALQLEPPYTWSTMLLPRRGGRQGHITHFPVQLRALTQSLFCSGWRRLSDGTLVLVLSTSACRLWNISQCMQA